MKIQKKKTMEKSKKLYKIKCIIFSSNICYYRLTVKIKRNNFDKKLKDILYDLINDKK